MTPVARAFLPALVLATASCAAPSRVAGESGCDAGRVKWAVGQVATQDVAARVWRESGAGLFRPVAPGQALTRDMRGDRITVFVDKANVITALRCE